MPAKRSSRKQKAPVAPQVLGSAPFALPVEWASSDEMPTIYANQLILSNTGGEFYLLFGEAVPPLIVDATQLPDKVIVRPVIRLAIPVRTMLRIRDAIERNVGRFVEDLNQISVESQEPSA
jgi:hypothetical protein